MRYDLLIKGGTILDGSGMPRYGGDVGVRDGRVAAIGRLSGAAARTIDADGLVVAPGLVDVHTHYDPQLTFEPLATSSVWHGVTTVVGGNCGFTLAPCRPADRDYMVRMFARVEGMNKEVLDAALPWSWESFPEFLDTLDRRLGVNAMVFAGHSALRRYVLGEEANTRAATEDEVRRMKDLLREALAAGAAGFTTSLTPAHVDGDSRPVPSRAATREETLALAAALAESNTGAIELASRTEGWPEAERRAFLADLSFVSGNRPVLAGGVGFGSTNPEVRRTVQTWLEGVAARGGRFIVQVRSNPNDRVFNFGEGPTLDTLPVSSLDQLPTWQALLARPPAERLAAEGGLRDPAVRARMREEVDHPRQDPTRGRMLMPPRWKTVLVANTIRPEYKRYEGRFAVDIAAEEGRHVADVLLDLAVAEDLATQFLYRGQDETEEALLGAALASPFAMVGTSDGGAHLERDDGAEWTTHFLHYWVGQKQIMSLEQGIHKLTFYPASVMGLAGRGLVREGYAADLFLFDPAAIRPLSKHQVADFPTGATRYVTVPAGVHATIVNGEVLVEAGRHTGAYPGRVLRPGRPAS
jgi:N-acyl-D-aspartate/D-glutamate deacylase